MQMRISVWLLICCALIVCGCTLPATGSGGQQSKSAPGSQSRFACPVTLPNGKQPVGNVKPGLANDGNDAGTLFTNLWPDGRVVFQAGGPGQVLQDGSLEMKWAWTRSMEVSGPLQITGQRLDMPAPPLGADLRGLGDYGTTQMRLVFPTPGCWEVTGRAADATLTFVTLVVKEL